MGYFDYLHFIDEETGWQDVKKGDKVAHWSLYAEPLVITPAHQGKLQRIAQMVQVTQVTIPVSWAESCQRAKVIFSNNSVPIFS